MDNEFDEIIENLDKVLGVGESATVEIMPHIFKKYIKVQYTGGATGIVSFEEGIARMSAYNQIR